MQSNQQFSLQQHNSFNVVAICPKIFFPSSLADLQQLSPFLNSPFYILGEGSNTLFIDEYTPTIIKPNFLGIDVVESEHYFEVHVGATENWHNLVSFCIEKGINGLENLALIPGSVGAAPVQNIGAYGVEFADFCQQVEYFDLESAKMKKLTNSQCLFSYRDSIFKSPLRNQAIITKITLKFEKNWRAKLSYQGLDHLPAEVSAKEVMEQVIKIRQQKLPDPNALPNAGSFFKNPVVTDAEHNRLKALYPSLPSYPQNNGLVKVAAGWLIEQSGLKGYKENGVGVHKHQALVLVNYESESGQDVVQLAKHVQKQVLDKFGVLLSPEVRLVGAVKEESFADLTTNYEHK